MADEDEDDVKEEAGPSAADLESKLKTNRIILIVGSFLSVTIFAIMLTGLAVLYLKLEEISPADGEPSAEVLAMEERFAKLESKLAALSDFRKGELKKIAGFTDQLERVYADCSSEKTAPFKDLLVSREKDFQELVKLMMSGTTDLSGMAKGSRAWVKQHNKKLDQLIKKSAGRQIQLKD